MNTQYDGLVVVDVVAMTAWHCHVVSVRTRTVDLKGKDETVDLFFAPPPLQGHVDDGVRFGKHLKLSSLLYGYCF